MAFRTTEKSLNVKTIKQVNPCDHGSDPHSCQMWAWQGKNYATANIYFVFSKILKFFIISVVKVFKLFS